MNAQRLDVPKQKTARYAVKAVLFALAAAFFALLPAVIEGGGALLLRSDFNYQQIVFQMLTGDFYKSGNFGWSPVTDLGSGIIGSYSFYNLASPFTLLTAFLPATVVPYMTAPVLIIKYCVAALTAFFFIKRFVKNYDTAVFGAVLYAFCGFQTVNLMFPFHDVTALFPLLLIGVEELVENRRYGVLAFGAALCCFTNYYFFFGEILFLVLYFIFRFVVGKVNFKEKASGVEMLKKVGLCLLEGALGLGISAVILLPSALSVMQNPRIDSSVSEILFQWPRYFTIIQGFFLPADVMGSQGYFLEKACTSCSLCLPLVAMAFAFSYALRHKKSGFTWMSFVMCLIAAVPVLNSAFSLFNAQYYARWFYMAAMIFALMSAIILDETAPENSARKDRKELVYGAAINTAITLLVVGAEFLLILFFTITEHPYLEKINITMTALYAVFAVGCCGILLLILRINNSKKLITTLTVATLAVSIITTGAAALRYKRGGVQSIGADGITANPNNPLSEERTLEIYNDITAEKLGLPQGDNYRINTAWYGEGLDYYQHSYDNLSMIIDVPSVNGFISTVSGGIFEFYNNLGLDRRVTAPSFDDPSLLALLSCRYFLTTNPTCEAAAGKTPTGQYTHSDGTVIYCFEYDNFLPMGLTYNYYLTSAELEKLPESNRSFALLCAAVIDDNDSPDLEKFSATELYKKLSQKDFQVSDEELSAAISAHKNFGFSNFTYTDNGFTASVDNVSSGRNIAYFSVPYDNGWTATVNGNEAEIINSSGMMAIPLTEGSNEVVFTYRTPGFTAGAVISAVCLVVAVGYCVVGTFLKKKRVIDNE